MNKSFEEQLKQLETVVKELENKDISLDDAIKKYKEGIELSKVCYEKIKQAEELVIKEIK
ncbi:putative Exodeoxyribonuclease 7, small subunit [Alteracholeplasma palmae J233]|uniref:Exodeoxyribonuclease 7 small subunit n=1 Tax=Alteracholeplasma palmae (strain ATCC 49389 / J233) TaxID=1318466 RepID=U4KQI7_ALTPJ|nr:exodeoxyribonuclease VII small subunit [Alteracholeplasma palmae]CCV64650.1 putative Exodeoxyribonuclease 7, small subunit [Alteracholeplasma palmae J233]